MAIFYMLLAKIYINNSRHLARKYARIFVPGHYLFLVAHSFLRASLSENCELRGTDFVEEIKNIRAYFRPNGGYCLYYPSKLFHQLHQLTFCLRRAKFNSSKVCSSSLLFFSSAFRHLQKQILLDDNSQ